MKNNVSRLIRFIPLTTASFVISLGLLGCGEQNAGSLSQNSIVYCSEGSPESFNPQTITSGTTVDATTNQLYDRLISFNQNDNSIAPGIAKSWHVTRDGKMITFYLRKGVNFHHTDYFKPTRTLNADDVMFSFNRILNPEHLYYPVSGGQYPFFQSVEFDQVVEQIEKINDYTIRFKLTHPDSSFLSNLATDFAVILSQEYAQKLTLENKKRNIDIYPIGTGPYKLKEFHAGSLIRFYPHELYWKGQVAIKQLIFDITPSNTGRLTKLLTNECDVIAYPIAHKKIGERSDLILEAETSFNIGYLGFNTQKAPFDNVIVRKAIAYAINKKAILEAVYFGQAEIAKTIIPKASWAYDDSIPDQKYSIDKAKSLLVEAGYENGFTMDIWAMPVQRAYNPNALTMAKLIQADLQKIGITANIVSYEWATFLRRVAQGEHQSVLLGWSADHPDPDNFFTPLLSCSSTITGSNRAFWCNEEFDNLIQTALTTNNISQRKKYYAKALAIVAEELPLLPIAHSKRYQARNNKVHGKILSSFGGINFSEVSKK